MNCNLGSDELNSDIRITLAMAVYTLLYGLLRCIIIPNKAVKDNGCTITEESEHQEGGFDQIVYWPASPRDQDVFTNTL